MHRLCGDILCARKKTQYDHNLENWNTYDHIEDTWRSLWHKLQPNDSRICHSEKKVFKLCHVCKYVSSSIFFPTCKDSSSHLWFFLVELQSDFETSWSTLGAANFCLTLWGILAICLDIKILMTVVEHCFQNGSAKQVRGDKSDESGLGTCAT